MKAVFNWKDMEQFGIYPLTGEACGIGIRMLCDLDQRGVRLIEQFFGIDSGSMRPGRNCEGIKSIMLPFGILRDLAIFAMLATGCKIVVTFKGQGDIHGAVDDREVEQIRRVIDDPDQYPKVDEFYRAKGTAEGKLRNLSVATGEM